MIRRNSIIALLFLITIGVTANSAEISISRTDNAIGGKQINVKVSIDSIVSQISAFNLTLSYDQSVAFVYAVRPGNIFNECGWEYFNYRLISDDSLATFLPDFKVHLINVIGIASVAGAPVSICDIEYPSLFELGAFLSRGHNCHPQKQIVPLRFFWRDCNDNYLVSSSADTIFSAQALFENLDPSRPRDPFSAAFPGYGFPLIQCPAEESAAVITNIDFVNSVVSFPLVDSIDCRAGDINLNGIGYEVSDIILFICAFIYGFGCFDINPAGQIAQTECDGDGTVLTVSDLVCFIRKARGDYWLSKPAVTDNFGPVLFEDNLDDIRNFELESNSDLALAYLRFTPKSESQLNLSDFNFSQSLSKTGQIGDTITMMLIDFDGNPVLAAGENLLFEYTGDDDFEIEASFVDMAGQEFSFKLESGLIPETPILSQNYPNPFNPSTTIEFGLPANAVWNFEIFNIGGQLIKNYSGLSTGTNKVVWDGTNLNGASVSSGVYLYRIFSNDVSISRKMLLLK